MPKFRFVGDGNEHVMPDNSIILFGYEFIGKRAVNVTDANACKKLMGNHHFEQVGAEKKEKPTGDDTEILIYGVFKVKDDGSTYPSPVETFDFDNGTNQERKDAAENFIADSDDPEAYVVKEQKK